MTRIH